MAYEKLGVLDLDKVINNLGRRVTVYFIGFCVFFLISFVYSVFVHYMFTLMIAFIFIGLLLVYYMQTYIFVRITRLLQFDDKAIKEFINNKDEIFK